MDVSHPRTACILSSRILYRLPSTHPVSVRVSNIKKTRYIEKKGIPMIALWCPAFSNDD